MSDRDDGGAAFPHIDWPVEYAANDLQRYQMRVQTTGGMTLRDYFMTHAPPAPKEWLNLGDQIGGDDCGTIQDVVEMHIRWQAAYADAMLEARK